MICNKRNIFCDKDKFNVALYDANGLIVKWVKNGENVKSKVLVIFRR